MKQIHQVNPSPQESYYIITDKHDNFYAKTYSSFDAKRIAAADDLLEALGKMIHAYGVREGEKGPDKSEALSNAVNVFTKLEVK